MSSKYIFTYKKFIVRHEINAQKVGTDSMLLGAWTNYHQAKNILDIGTGCGLLSLMAAQQTPDDVEVTAVEIVKEFAEEALHNFLNSPWNDKIRIMNCDVNSLDGEIFDLIICNPPYFENQLKSPNENKSKVRHDVNLNLKTLPKICSRLLNSNGSISLVLPFSVFDEELRLLFEKNGLFLQRICKVRHKPERQFALVLIELNKNTGNVQFAEESLTVKIDEEKFSPEYVALMKDFLIIFP